jgi:multidrug efflux pump subunit AcrA (membrane-fusion protein)
MGRERAPRGAEMKIKLSFSLLFLFILAGCSVFSPAAPTALPTVVLGNGAASPASPQASGGGVTASGTVEPAQEAQLASTLSGNVKTVSVEVGDAVRAGQALVQLEGEESLQAAVSTAGYGLVQAQQALADLTTAAETARLQAMQDVVTYQQAVKDAQYALDNFTIPSNQAGLDAVAAISKMKQLLDQARLAFEPYKNKPSGDQTRKDRKEALDNAQADYNTAVRRLQYEYDLEVAQAQLDKARHDYEVLSAGPDPDKLRLAEARQTNAENQLSAAQAALGQLTITAPFSGVVSQVNFHSGEWVVAGQPVLTLADVAHLRVETTDLSERDVPRVSINQPVTVFVKALNQNLSGHVSLIAPLADKLGGDVVYKVTIELDTIPPELRAGMSVEVQFGAGG